MLWTVNVKELVELTFLVAVWFGQPSHRAMTGREICVIDLKEAKSKGKVKGPTPKERMVDSRQQLPLGTAEEGGGAGGDGGAKIETSAGP
jgi:hypothetical protein